MLAGERLKVALVTTHMALVDVPAALTAAEILATIRITAASLRRFFGRTDPRLAVLALNPHAGEGGLFGGEEERADSARPSRRPGGRESPPAGRTAPIPSFTSPRREPTTRSSACTTIRGLIPLKLLHFDDGVNVTLGLPIVRTSVDHGTAYDLAGTGRASEKSLIAAIRMAEEMVNQARGPRPKARGKPQNTKLCVPGFPDFAFRLGPRTSGLAPTLKP